MEFNSNDLFKSQRAKILSAYGIDLNKVNNLETVNNLDIKKSETDSKDDLIKSQKISDCISLLNELDEKDIKKSFENALESIDLDLIKASSIDKTNLIPQKVKITRKDGSISYAIRWVNKDSNAPVDTTHVRKFKNVSEIPGDTIDEKLSHIVNKDYPKSQKTRDLISIGIYDRDLIAKLNGNDKGYARIMSEEANIDSSDFFGYVIDEEGNIKEPEALVLNPSDSEGFKKYKPNIDISMSIELARESLNAKDFDAFKKEKIKSIKDKFGISADSMWLSYDRSIRQLLDTGQPKSIIAFGTGGVGKTYTLEQILKDYVEKQGLRLNEPELDLEPEDYDVLSITGSTGKHDLWGTLYKHKDDKVIIFDDCDSMWNDQDMINWFKGMLDSSGDGTVRYGQGDKVKLEGKYDEDGEPLRAPRSFRFTSKVIFISNMDREGFIKAGAGPLFESRCKAIDLTMNKEQTLDKLNKISKFITIRDNLGNAIPGVTDADREKAMTVINELSDFVEVSKLNGRTLGNLIGTAVYYRKNNFSNEEFVQEAVSLLTA